MARLLRKLKDSLLGKPRKKTSDKIGAEEEAPATTVINAQPVSIDVAVSFPNSGLDPWARAYDIFKHREPELEADYKKHLASLQVDTTSGADLSSPLSVESIVKRLLADRNGKQWQVPLLGKDVKIREQVERLAKFVLWSDEIVKSALSTQPYAALAWSGVSILLPLLTSGAKQNEAMLKGFNSIGDLQVYWQISEKVYLESSQGQNYPRLIELLAKLYSHIVEYQARVICHLSNTQLSRAWQDVVGENDWDSLVSEINGLSKICSDCIPPLNEQKLRQDRDCQLQGIEKSQNILSEIRRILEEGEKQSQRRYEDQVERDLLRDLASDYESYKSFNPPRVAGTCEWFFDDDRFGKWRDSNDSSLLWVSAGPGCGKSVLSRALIDEQRLSTRVTTSTVCHFFFKDGDQRRMNSTNALCAMLHQLFTKDFTSSLIEHALPSYRKNAGKLMENFTELWGILENCANASNAGEIICLIDALDECDKDSRSQLITQLEKFYKSQAKSQSRPSKLKFLITSRPYDDLEESFKGFSDTATYLRFDGDDKSEKIGQEINFVIDARMCHIGYGLSDEGRRIIAERLKSMKNRTYLWLHLTFDIIKQSPSEYSRRQDIEELLSNLPTQVSDAYENILSRSKETEKTITLLQIMLAATRPLSLDEANIALTLALEKKWYTSYAQFKEYKWHDPDSFKIAVKNICGLLVSVYGSKLYFLHQTIREFLTAEPDTAKKWKGRFNKYESHSTLSLSCLRLLYLERSDYLHGDRLQSSSYPASEWLSHYVKSKNFTELRECHHYLWNLTKSRIRISIISNEGSFYSNTLGTYEKMMYKSMSMIEKIDPFCNISHKNVKRDKIYAKPKDATKAVNGVMAPEVDIILISCDMAADTHQLREAVRKAMSAISNSQTHQPLMFCPAALKNADAIAVSFCNKNIIRVAADTAYGSSRSPSRNDVDILIPSVDIGTDAPVDAKEFVTETMSDIATATAAGIASLALLLLRVHNDDQDVLSEFLQKHKMMQVFGKMSNGQRGIQLSQLFGYLDVNDIASRWKIANFS